MVWESGLVPPNPRFDLIRFPIPDSRQPEDPLKRPAGEKRLVNGNGALRAWDRGGGEGAAGRLGPATAGPPRHAEPTVRDPPPRSPPWLTLPRTARQPRGFFPVIGVRIRPIGVPVWAGEVGRRGRRSGTVPPVEEALRRAVGTLPCPRPTPTRASCPASERNEDPIGRGNSEAVSPGPCPGSGPGRATVAADGGRDPRIDAGNRPVSTRPADGRSSAPASPRGPPSATMTHGARVRRSPPMGGCRRGPRTTAGGR